MPTYQWVTNSNAAPMVSDSGAGFIEAESPEAALRQIVAKYTHPCGLYCASIRSPDVANKTLAMYKSSRAATSLAAGTGTHETIDGKLFVNGVEAEVKPEHFEVMA